MTNLERIKSLRDLLSQRVLVLDGAMGTKIQQLALSARDFGGASFEGCNENLVLTRPDVIKRIHSDYLLAGADIIETNTFGATPLVLEEFALGKYAYQINKKAAELAREAAAEFDSVDRKRYVAGAIGPTTKSLSVTGGIAFDELVEHFFEQARGLYDGGVDYFLIETCQDTRNIKAALLGIDRLQNSRGIKLPIAVSVTIETMGTMLAGQSAEAVTVSLMHRDLLYLGFNCATGPEFMTDSLRSISDLAPFPVACVPNAGLPDENGHYLETPEMMVQVLRRFGEKGWLNLIGGCCGTTENHIKAFAQLAKGLTPRSIPAVQKSFLSGIDCVEVSDEARPLLVGERTNVIGSRKFKELIVSERWDEAAEIAKLQIKKSAQIIDICLANPDRDEFADMRKFLESVTKKIATPLMIDSTDHHVIDMALSYSQGKSLINSINLEDGEERFELVCPLVHKWGAAVVVGLIDDDPQQGMGVTRERKLEIAERSFELLTKKYGIKPEDIYWDALVFPCGTGDAQYLGSAVETIEAIRLLKEKYPLSKTVLGISNVSFGLPSAGREVLNSVFLYHCTKAGLDLAIVNTEGLSRYADLDAQEIELCEGLLWNKTKNAVDDFNQHFGSKQKAPRVQRESLPLEQRLSQAVREGSKEGLFGDLTEALKSSQPMDIINGPLMEGMDEVGRLFNANKLIVAEVLQSAEVMKAAVDYLKSHMKKSEESLRGKVILATVKGDVHDIGKNLVEIILSNNGFEVINLGIKVLSQTLIEACHKNKPQIIGLSGLLVKSAQQMVETAADFKQANIQVPILVGGAALTRNFVDRKIAPAYGAGFVEYASDAMAGLDLAKQIVNPSELVNLKSRVEKRRTDLEKSSREPSISSIPVSRRLISDQPITVPPDCERHEVQLPLDIVWRFINPLMLLGKHLGVKGDAIRALSDSKVSCSNEDLDKAKRVQAVVEELKSDAKEWMSARAVYQFYKAHRNGDALHIESNQNVFWKFKRQSGGEQLCLSDFVSLEKSRDSICLFVTSCAGNVRKRSEVYKERGDFLKSHALLSLSLETAEAAAEYLHSLIRSQWGFSDDPEMTMMQRFQARYRGKRFSFGYPACPELEYQKELFDLLRPESIGVNLTEGFMMDPECSVSALVFSHPEAKYFAV